MLFTVEDSMFSKNFINIIGKEIECIQSKEKNKQEYEVQIY